MSRDMKDKDLERGQPECEYVEELIPAYLGRKLSAGELEFVSQHILHCTNCQKVLEEEKRLSSLLEQLPEAPPGSVLGRTIAAKEHLRRRIRLLRASGTAAAAAVLVSVGIFLAGQMRFGSEEEALIAHLPVIEEVDALVQATEAVL